MKINKTQIRQQLTSGKALVLLDQAVVSGGNFVLGVLLARMLGLEVFGTYSLLWMGVLFALSLHQAYLTQPMLSLFAGKNRDEQPGYLRQLFRLQCLISGSVALLSILSFGILKIADMRANWLAAVPLTGFVTSVFLMQDFLRKSFFVKKEYRQPLFMDLALYLPLLTGLPALHYTGRLDLETAMWFLFGTYALSSGLRLKTFIARPNEQFRSKFGTNNEQSRNESGTGLLTLHETAKEHYHYSIWLLGTSLLQWFSGNFFLVAAAGVLGTVAVGALRMAQNMVGLCHVLFLAMENIVPAEAAQHFFQHGKSHMLHWLRQVSIGASIPVVLMLGSLTLASPWLIRWLYGSEYLAYSYLVGTYAILYIFVFIGHPLRFALRTLHHTSPIFVAYCLSSAVSVLAAFPMTRAWGMNGVMAGLLGTQLLTLVVYLFFLSNQDEKSFIKKLQQQVISAMSLRKKAFQSKAFRAKNAL